MATTQGSTILASDINSIFSRLETLRAEHYSGAGQSSEAQAALSTPFNSSPVTQGNTIYEPYTLMKQYLNTLRNSVFLTSITSEMVDAITVPSAGTLITLTSLNTGTTLIENIEELPFTNSTNFSGFNGTNFSGFNGTNFGTNFTCFNNNGTNFSSFNGTNFSSFNSSNRATPFVCLSPFSPFFSSFKGSNNRVVRSSFYASGVRAF